MAIPSLNIGGGKWATKKDKLLAYKQNIGGRYFAINGDTSRNSTATFINQNGLIESVGNNVARVDFQENIEGVLKLEPQSTNLTLWSQDFSQSYWSKLGATVVSGQDSPSLDSPLGAFKLTENSANSSHRVQSNFTSVDSTDYTLSVFAKKGERNYISLQINPKSNAYISTIFNLDNGTIVGQSAGSSAPISSKIKYIENGFYKCEITVNISTGAGTTNVRVFVSDNPTNITYQGDGTSGVYIYGAQLEALPYATSYIPTSSSSVTRVQDVATDFGDVNTFNSEEGTLFVECSGFTDSAARLISLSDGTNTNRMYIGYSSTFITAVVVVGGGLSYVYNFVSSGVSDTVKIALKYKENDFTLYVNGVKKNFQLSGSIYPINILNRLSFDSGAGASNFYGETKQLQVYKEALTDAELITLTTI